MGMASMEAKTRRKGVKIVEEALKAILAVIFE
jgi:hypothetical protein